MLKQMMVDIDEDEVVVTSLTDTLEYIESCLRTPETTSIFSFDQVEETRKLKKFRKALKKVLDWYTP